jgi:hypothetical protein
MTDAYTAAVDALYDARDRGRGARTPTGLDEAARDVVDSVRPIIEAEVRERIAAEIEAEARQVLTDDGAGQFEKAGLLDAARIARGLRSSA